MNKLENFPTVNYINLHESVDRRLFMNSQIEKYGLKSNPYFTDRYAAFKDQIQISLDLPEGNWQGGQEGNNISYLSAMKKWYNTTDEEYGFFCDDDISFETVDYWTFTWQEFLDNLPQDWQCVQLVRINIWEPGIKNYGIFEIPAIQIRERSWGDFGCAAIFKREYVKKVLDRHCISPNNYDFNIRKRDNWNFILFPIVESLLYREISDGVYNCPLLLENQIFESTVHPNDADARLPHNISYKYYSGLWKLFGSELPLSYIINKS